MLSLVRRLGNDDFLQQNAVFFSGSVAVGFLNYLFYLVLGRIMTVEEFGDVQAFLSLFLLLTVLNTAYGLVAVTSFSQAKDAEKPPKGFQELYAFASAVMGGVALLLLVATPFLQKGLHVASSKSFGIIALLLLLETCAAFGRAYLQAQQQFGRMVTSHLLAASCRLLFAAVLVWMGLSVPGVLIGLFLAHAVSFRYVLRHSASHVGFPAWRNLRMTPDVRAQLQTTTFVSQSCSSVRSEPGSTAASQPSLA
jgi:O-antigen/teichoic acid export membrane protein